MEQFIQGLRNLVFPSKQPRIDTPKSVDRDHDPSLKFRFLKPPEMPQEAFLNIGRHALLLFKENHLPDGFFSEQDQAFLDGGPLPERIAISDSENITIEKFGIIYFGPHRGRDASPERDNLTRENVKKLQELTASYLEKK